MIIIRINNKEIKNNKGNNYYNNSNKNGEENYNEIIEVKKNQLKIILGSYIKEKELDIFFEKLLTSYSINEKNKITIEETLSNIKDLVSKKVNLLIKILFAQDEKGWYNSLKLKEDDKDAKEYYFKLTGMIEELMKFDKIQEIPENMIKTFGETLLTTPELNSQINKLVIKKFE